MEPASLVGLRWSAIRKQAQAFLDQRPARAFEQAAEWYALPAWEQRSFALAVLGGIAAQDVRAQAFLFERCGADPAWQVNEALAMAFDDCCAVMGYAQAIPLIQQWLHAPEPNLRRAVSEGLRPWTASKRAIFAQDPQRAIELLGTLRDDASRYVQESCGNALRDISRKHFVLVLGALRAWLAESPHSQPRKTIAKFALERAVKDDPSLRQLYE